MNRKRSKVIDKSEESPVISTEKEEAKKKVSSGRALLLSKLDYPVDIQYGDAIIRVSPRAKLIINDSSLLPNKLPHGIILKKL